MQQTILRRALSRTRPSSYPTLIARRAATSQSVPPTELVQDGEPVVPLAANKSNWILSPVLDGLFVCGGLLLIVAASFSTVEMYSGPSRPMVFP